MSSSSKPEPGKGSAEHPPREKAVFCAKCVLDKKAYRTVVLDVGGLTDISDYFVICSGRSVRQTRAIADHVRQRVKALLNEIPLGVEGEGENTWLLLDYGDVVVHVFYDPTRELYGLERLWSEAPRVQDPELEEEARRAAELSSGEEEDWEA